MQRAEECQATHSYYIDPSLFISLVESIPGPTTDRISAVARKHHMHVVYTGMSLHARRPLSAVQEPARRG
jgi:hypothetical protein